MKKNTLMCFFFLFLLLSGCQKKETALPGEAFLKYCGVRASKIDVINTETILRTNLLAPNEDEKEFMGPRDTIAPYRYWKTHFSETVLKNSIVSIPEKDKEAFQFDTQKWGAVYNIEWEWDYPDYGGFLLDLNNKPQYRLQVGDGLPLASVEITIARILAVDALAQKLRVTITEEDFQDFCKAYKVNKDNPGATTLAYYCCEEDAILRKLLPFPYMPLKELADKALTSASSNYGGNLPRVVEGAKLKKGSFPVLDIQIKDSNGKLIWEEKEVIVFFGYGTLGEALEKKMEGLDAGGLAEEKISEIQDGYFACFKDDCTIHIKVCEIRQYNDYSWIEKIYGRDEGVLFSNGPKLIPCWVIPENKWW